MITELHVDKKNKFLYASTYGRGAYKLNLLNNLSKPSVDLYVRDNILDTGEIFPSPSDVQNPMEISEKVYWYESPDIKIADDTSIPEDGVEFDNEFPLLIHGQVPHAKSVYKYIIEDGKMQKTFMQKFFVQTYQLVIRRYLTH